MHSDVFRLPAYGPDGKPPDRSALLHHHSLRKTIMKVLICDDDANYRAMLYEHLHSRSHDVLAVSDAMHAVALLSDANHGIDVVVLDLAMPRLGGDELIQTFAHWKNCSVHFVVISGAFDPEVYRDHPKVVGCLPKPFQLQALDGLIAEAGGRRSLAAEPVGIAC
jgi:DNA-binding NtrC family response regulator